MIDELNEIYDFINDAKAINLADLDQNKTALIIIDMINGFAKAGALSSNRIKDLISPIVDMTNRCNEKQVKSIAFADHHAQDSPEFISFPVHCLADSYEAEVVDEIKAVGNYQLIRKNSTNGFIEPEFQNWLKDNRGIDTFIIVGCCTDICILQFSLSLKAHFNRVNQSSRIIVPINLVDTYDLGIHNAELLNLTSLYQMSVSDIEIVKEII